MRFILFFFLLGAHAHKKTCEVLRGVYGKEFFSCTSLPAGTPMSLEAVGSSSFTVTCLAPSNCTVRVQLAPRVRRLRERETKHRRKRKHPRPTRFPTQTPSPSSSDPHCLTGHRVAVFTCCPSTPGRPCIPVRSCNESLPPCDLTAIQTLYVYYDQEMRKTLSKQLDATIQLAVQDANRVYRNSEIPILLRLVGHGMHPTLEDYEDSYSLLARFRNSDRRGANIAVFLSSRIQSCGRGYYDCMGFPDPGTCPYAVVRLSCVFGMYSMVHELGHISGADHNIGFKSVPISRFPDNYGYTLPTGVRTIMSISMYTGETRIPYFSNPRLSVDGMALGIKDKADNARVISWTRYDIAAL